MPAQMCWCGECKRCKGRERARKWREANREKNRAQARKRYARNTKDPVFRARENATALRSRRKHPNTALVIAARTGPCVDCGLQLPPECMDLDHVRGEKLFTLAQSTVAGNRWTQDQVREEIAKCDLRCPSCHRLRHYREREGVVLTEVAA